jgi:hypothetical protein
MDNETIATLEQKLETAMLNSDVVMLDNLLDDELVFTNHIGQQTTKQMDLEAHSFGVVKIDSISTSNQTVKIFENVAIVTVVSEICGFFGKIRSTANLHFTRVWQKKNNEEYKLIAAHSSLNENT